MCTNYSAGFSGLRIPQAPHDQLSISSAVGTCFLALDREHTRLVEKARGNRGEVALPKRELFRQWLTAAELDFKQVMTSGSRDSKATLNGFLDHLQVSADQRRPPSDIETWVEIGKIITNFKNRLNSDSSVPTVVHHSLKANALAASA